MSDLAHRRVTIDVHGPAGTILHTASLYCSADAVGGYTVKKWAREEAAKHSITLGAWDYLRHRPMSEWEGRVYGSTRGKPVKAPAP